ncbi:hypothetical protein E2C01_004745 [Portunus trituberculatus]|uniref:Uncharacterized protein n=1 Tax=Portunus trituberculatus TaxID=210409 RepID=A0A5B7CQG6_PORTR|nr:hypothetical protein [Portunus trituberculatus]
MRGVLSLAESSGLTAQSVAGPVVLHWWRIRAHTGAGAASATGNRGEASPSSERRTFALIKVTVTQPKF